MIIISFVKFYFNNPVLLSYLIQIIFEVEFNILICTIIFQKLETVHVFDALLYFQRIHQNFAKVSTNIYKAETGFYKIVRLGLGNIKSLIFQLNHWSYRMFP